MKKSNQTKLAATVSASLAVFAFSNAHAANPFSAQPLTHGYTVAEMDKAKDAACGADKAKPKEANCGADKAKADKMTKTKAKEGSCGADKAKATEATMKQSDKASEAACGAKK